MVFFADTFPAVRLRLVSRSMFTQKFSADSPGPAAAGPTMNFATHFKRTARLAGPMIVARAGHIDYGGGGYRHGGPLWHS